MILNNDIFGNIIMMINKIFEKKMERSQLIYIFLLKKQIKKQLMYITLNLVIIQKI